MKIIHCPKGGRISEGYCLKSCLNYPGKHQGETAVTLRKSWLKSYKEDILPKLKKAS